MTPDIAAAVELLVKDGQVEYEPSFARGAGGHFAVAAATPALELVDATPPPASPSQFARKKGR